MIASLVLTACSNPQQELKQRIENLNNIDSLQNPENAYLFNQALCEFVEKYPEDSLAANYTYLAAQSCNGLKAHDKAIQYFKLFKERYPDDIRAGDATFLIGFIYANELNQLDSALNYYEDMVVLYPNHRSTPAAQSEIRNLGKTPEQIYQEFMQNDSLRQQVEGE